MDGTLAAALTAIAILLVGDLLVRRAASAGPAAAPAVPEAPEAVVPPQALPGELKALLGLPSLADPVGREVAALRLRLVDYGPLAAKLEPFELFDFENVFYSLILRAVEGYQGEIDRFDGEQVLVVFGRILNLDDVRGSAVGAAQALRRALDERLGEGVPERLRATLRPEACLALAAGRVVAGPVGCDYRKVYTAFGGPLLRLDDLLRQAAPGEVAVGADDGFQGVAEVAGVRRSGSALVVPKGTALSA